ncbi:MAG: hypothetical protein Q4B17_00230 [Lautropia sp.]|nr:hypothetical protein [Lautropia sp.]
MMIKRPVEAVVRLLPFSTAFGRVAGPGLAAIVLAGCTVAGKAPPDDNAGMGTPLTRDDQRTAAISRQADTKPVPAPEPEVGMSLSELAPALLPEQNSAACLAEIEAMAERYSGRRVMLGNAAFRDRSELVLDQPFVRDRSGKVVDGKRLGRPEPFVMQLRFGPRGCMVVVPAQPSAIRPVPASALLPNCRCQRPASAN